MRNIESIKIAYARRQRIHAANLAYNWLCRHFETLCQRYGYQYVADCMDAANAIRQPLMQAQDRLHMMRQRRLNSLARHTLRFSA